METVGIVSFPRYFNYGTYLQLYALQESIAREGYTVEVIDYGRAGPAPQPLGSRISAVLRNPGRLVSGIQRRRLEARRRPLLAARNRRFASFLSSDIRLGQTSYRSFAELQARPPHCDAFVVGSDQVWNPMGHYGDSTYFLQFAPESRRIAYAASIGVSSIPQEQQAWMRESLQGMRFIGVREEDGAALVEQLTGNRPRVVVDPTLLFRPEDWFAFATEAPRMRPYLLQYVLQDDEYVRQRIAEVARRLDLKVVVLPVHPRDLDTPDPNAVCLFDVGPREFVGLFQQASFVCTDSFHGTVFAIQCRRPFLTFKRYKHRTESATFSRMDNLLGRLQLLDRVQSQEVALPDSLDESVSVAAYAKLEEWRQESLAYLTSALREATAEAS